MSPAEIQAQVADIEGTKANWQAIVGDIERALESATSLEERCFMLDLFKTTMDIAETGIAAGDLDKFQEARKKRIGGWLLREAIIGDQICAETLADVTQREVKAGRLADDDPLRVFALHGLTAPHPTREELLAKAAQQAAQDSE